MAIYHLHASTGNRGHDGSRRRGKNRKPKAGQSAKAKFDYISREGKYTRDPGEVLFSESGNMPAWAADSPGSYWDAADLYERANGRLFKEVEFALPRELTLEQQIDTIRSFAEYVAGADNLPFTFAVHEGKGRNPHCHLMLNERINDGLERTADTWFKRAANKGKPAENGGARKSEMLKPGDWLDNTRAAWSSFANDALERFGHNQRIDHRTLAAQRIDRLPQVHIGPNVAAMAERGIFTDRWERFELVTEYNQLRTEQADLELEIAVAAEAMDAESRTEHTFAETDALDIQPPIIATAPYVPDEPEPQVDDELILARKSQQRDLEDHIGRKHWLQIRAELRQLYATQQRLDAERKAAAASPSPAAPKESKSAPTPVVKKPPQAAPLEASEPKTPVPKPATQAPPEPTFDARQRAHEIVKMNSPGERHAAMLSAAKMSLEDFDALDIELEQLMDALTGELTEKGLLLRAELVPRAEEKQAREEDNNEPDDWRRKNDELGL